jgi:redox-sensing transcriptional repressor
VAIGIIATPAAVAQSVADRLVEAGVTSILNFAPAVISVPNHAALRKVDLALELQILSFYRQRDSIDAPDVGASKRDAGKGDDEARNGGKKGERKKKGDKAKATLGNGSRKNRRGSSKTGASSR